MTYRTTLGVDFAVAWASTSGREHSEGRSAYQILEVIRQRGPLTARDLTAAKSFGMTAWETCLPFVSFFDESGVRRVALMAVYDPHSRSYATIDGSKTIRKLK